MGFFSYKCKCCGESIKAPYGLAAKHQWMNEVTCVLEDGAVLQGDYDGYGGFSIRYDDLQTHHLYHREDIEVSGIDDRATIYHTQCWEKAGKPGFQGGMERAEDQGYFDDLSD